MLLLLLSCSTPPAVPTTAAVPAPHDALAPRRNRTAQTLTVDCTGGGQYLDILDALDDAESGDNISVAPCTYYGSIKFGGKSVAITSTGGAAVTKILGTPGKWAVKVEDGEGSHTSLSGFTISGGGGPLEPAIDVSFSALKLSDNIISGNSGLVVVYNRGGKLLVERTLIEENTTVEGMVIQGRRGATVVKDSTVRCGDNRIGFTVEHGASLTDGSTFDCGQGISVEVYHAPGRIQRSILTGVAHVENEETGQERTTIENTVLLGGLAAITTDITVRNVVSTGPIASTGASMILEGSILTGANCGLQAQGAVSARNNIFWGNTMDTCGGIATPVGSNGNLAADPLLVDIAGGDFHLASGSPAVDQGPEDAGYADPDGSRNDIGAYGGPLSAGGNW